MWQPRKPQSTKWTLTKCLFSLISLTNYQSVQNYGRRNLNSEHYDCEIQHSIIIIPTITTVTIIVVIITTNTIVLCPPFYIGICLMDEFLEKVFYNYTWVTEALLILRSNVYSHLDMDVLLEKTLQLDVFPIYIYPFSHPVLHTFSKTEIYFC